MAAKFVFSDQTNLALGPTSTVKLDRFVYKGETSYAKAAVNFAAGAFRFTTGASEKGAYQSGQARPPSAFAGPCSTSR